LRIKRISVDGLFGIFNHDISMKLDDRITIIHGLNGYGKTTILRMVNALFNKRYADLRSTPYKEFRVELEDGATLSVTKVADEGRPSLTKGESRKKRIRGIKLRLMNKGKEIEHTELPSPMPEGWQEHMQYPLHAIEQFIPGLTRESRNTWRYLPSDEELVFEDVIDRFSDHLPPDFLKPEKKHVEWLHELQKSVKVRFIESQRLLRLSKTSRRSREYEHPPALELSVAIHADDLAKAIQGKLAEYATLSQSLDRTFPVRLVEQMQSGINNIAHTSPTPDLRRQLTELENK
jgi:hypothetical protein